MNFPFAFLFMWILALTTNALYSVDYFGQSVNMFLCLEKSDVQPTLDINLMQNLLRKAIPIFSTFDFLGNWWQCSDSCLLS